MQELPAIQRRKAGLWSNICSEHYPNLRIILALNKPLVSRSDNVGEALQDSIVTDIQFSIPEHIRPNSVVIFPGI